jgi:hypothetical protein
MKECTRFGRLYLLAPEFLGVVSEGASPRRFAVAGAALFAGLVFGMFLSATFRWSPFYWQWLAYHNGLVAGVLIYLLLSDPEDARSMRIPPHEILPRAPPARREDRETARSTGWE